MKPIAILTAVLAAAPSTHAWGELGHSTIAYVASNFLTPATVKYCRTILGDTSASYLASVAPWADTYRSESAGRFSAPFHFVDALDNPPTSCDVVYSRDCGTGGCVISAINNYVTLSPFPFLIPSPSFPVSTLTPPQTARIQNPKLSSTDTAEALKFLVHFIGDIHQPLHDENYDLGGNDVSVTFAGTSTNLHAVWDTYIPEKYAGSDTLPNASKWAATLTTAIKSGAYKSQAAGWLAGVNLTNPIATATLWASQANAFVCSEVVPSGWSAVAGKDLSTSYYTAVLPTVQLQHATAGYRLAAWLNLIATGSTGLATREVHEGFEEGPVAEVMRRGYEATRELVGRAAPAYCAREL
ncbi:hypothetical protein MMC13_004860 [Lambiella insularis]|nr:hypothetical protein [Lambiella insularis]